MKFIYKALILLSMSLAVGEAAAQVVVEDQGVGLSREELEYIVKFWSPDMQQAAANDPGDRIELLNMALANKKLAAMAGPGAAKADPEAYWRLQLSIRNLQSQYVVKQHLASLDIPDMTALAEERYKTQKDVYALVPEERYSSHILLLCAPGACDRDARRIEAEKILAELEAGADFRQLATKYSEDPGSKDKGGQFDKWVKLGEAQVDPYYVGAVYELENVGDHSGIVDTKFGLHIVQLDGVKEAHYKSFEEVKDQIIAALRKEYIQLSAKKFDAGFRFTDDTYIDNAAVEEILHPFKTAE